MAVIAINFLIISFIEVVSNQNIPLCSPRVEQGRSPLPRPGDNLYSSPCYSGNPFLNNRYRSVRSNNPERVQSLSDNPFLHGIPTTPGEDFRPNDEKMIFPPVDVRRTEYLPLPDKKRTLRDSDLDHIVFFPDDPFLQNPRGIYQPSGPNKNAKRKCEMKCDEYIQRHLDISSNRERGLCGPPEEDHRTVYTLVSGGTPAALGEYPHMVALGWLSRNAETEFLCGGSLISERWVLTAAHCTHTARGSPKVVRIGMVSLNDPAGKEIRIKRIHRHPDYKPPAMYSDIALLNLAKVVRFGKLARPACLYTGGHKEPRKVSVTGWGTKEFEGDGSKLLLEARLDVINNANCSPRYNQTRAIPQGLAASMVCAGDLGGWVRDACQGDSGGPIQMFHPTSRCQHQVFGIVSFGAGCAFPEYPSVYTRASHFLDWIESIVWPDHPQ